MNFTKWVKSIKVGFLQKVMAKFSNLSNRHACEPRIVPEHLFPVSVINKLQVTFWIHLAKEPACHELWCKSLNRNNYINIYNAFKI